MAGRRKNNVLFVGTNKTLGILESLLTNTHIKSALLPHRTIVKYDASDSERVYIPQGISYSGPRKDHVVVYKLPGPSVPNCILIFTCTDNAGVLQSIKSFTDPALSAPIIDKMREKHGYVPRYFEMLLEVSSISRTGFRTTYAESFEIKPDVDLVKHPEGQ